MYHHHHDQNHRLFQKKKNACTHIITNHHLTAFRFALGILFIAVIFICKMVTRIQEK